MKFIKSTKCFPGRWILNRDKLTDPRITRRNVITFYMQEIMQSELIYLFISIPSSPSSTTRDVGAKGNLSQTETFQKLAYDLDCFSWREKNILNTLLPIKINIQKWSKKTDLKNLKDKRKWTIFVNKYIILFIFLQIQCDKYIHWGFQFLTKLFSVHSDLPVSSTSPTTT